MLQLRSKIIFLLMILALPAFCYEDGIRISWDFRTAKKVTNGVYSRIHAINNGQWAIVYSDGPDVWIRKSSDNCNTWSNQILVAHNDGYNNTNAELVRLANGWLIYAWNGRPMNENTVPYIIKTKISKDNGQTWIDERLVYTADVTFQNGCWEPAMMQLPSGEVQLFFANENPYRNNFDQEISMFRSQDNGLTWTNYTTTSYRQGFRDGMAVPVRLLNNKGMVYCIEDNGLNGNFKPTIIYSSNEDNWTKGAALWNSPRRWGALRSDYALGSPVYAGAPYITQFPSGETILSIQSSEGRTSGDQAMPQVYLGSDEAKNFSRKSTPMPWLPAAGNALWNSLTIINDTTVILSTSVNAPGVAGGIWTVRGTIIKPMNAPKAVISVDGTGSEPEWALASSVFLGSQTESNLTAKIAYDDQNLYILCDVKDKNLWAESPSIAWDDDGIEVYIDPQNKSCAGTCPGMYKLLINIGARTLYDKVNAANAFETWTPKNLNYKIKTNGVVNDNTEDVGYVIEASIPWSEIGGKPLANAGWGIHFKLHDDDNGAAAEFHEDLSGNDPNKASTYLKASLDYGADGKGLTGLYYTGQNFDNYQFKRLDPIVSFNWTNGSPDTHITNDNFSIKWKGFIEVPATGEYTFYINSDNGRKLTINNTTIIDQWIDDWDKEYSGKITLEKGIKYSIEIDYFENAGGANIAFQWSSTQLAKSIVPKTFLYPNDDDTEVRYEPAVIPGTIQAEAFIDYQGIQSEPCEDTGGGKNIGYITKGDWVDYDVNILYSGNYNLKFRVSSSTNGGKIIVKSGSTVLATVSVSGTGDWNTWATISSAIALEKGRKTLRLEFDGGTGDLFNINWIEALPVKDCSGTDFGTAAIDVCGICSGGKTGINPATDPSACVTSIIGDRSKKTEVYPNPFEESIYLELASPSRVHVMNLEGKVVTEKQLEQSQWLKLDVSPGIYVLKILNGEQTEVKMVMKR